MTREEQFLQIGWEKYNNEADLPKRKAFFEGIKWADANRWVKVEDGLPETNDKFHESDHLLCYDEITQTMFVGWYNSFHGCWYVSHFRASNEPVSVTHYSKRPEPPKAEQ